VLIEPGDVFFASEHPPGGFMRLGFQAIETRAIDAGIRELGQVVAALRRPR